jgi:hypothetical protein
MSTITAALINSVSHGIRLRAIGAGASTFADQTWVYDSGTITSATDAGSGNVTIGDSTKVWMTSPHHRWVAPVAGADGVATWDWVSYDLVIEAPNPDYTPDPRKVLQARITAQADATHVTVSLGLADRIAEGRLAAVGDLVGRRYWILRAGGSNWTRGYFDQPNDPHYSAGKVAAFDATAHTITLDRLIQNTDLITAAGSAEVVFVGADGHLQRVTLTTAGGAVLTTAAWASDPVVDAWVYVIQTAGVWVWDAQGGNAQTAYSGLRADTYLGHGTDDELATVAMPTLSFSFTYGTNPLSCPLATSTPIFNRPEDGRDIDLWYPQDNACGTRDTFVNERMHKNVRDWWSDLMGICTGYVPNQSYDGSTSISAFTIATWLYTAGINPVSGTCGTHSGGSMPCALSVPHTPVTLWWSILDDDGAPLLSGYHDAYDGSTITGTFSAVHDGKAVVGSVGPKRPVPKRFGRMFDVTYFLPDEDSGAAQTPSNTFPGTWTIRAKSTHYLMADADHFVSDSVLARHLITNGDYARYVGDQRDDPGLAAMISDPDDPLAPYHNNAYVGTRAATTQRRIDGSLSGTATGGSNLRLEDSSRDWLAVDFYDATNGIEHLFTAASGSTTGCTVPGASGTDLWASARFPGFSGPFVGFTVEFITNPGDLVDPADFDDPLAVIEKRIIGTGTTGGVLTWVEATSVSVNGLAGRIHEPAVLNRWAGYAVRLVRVVDGAVTNDVTVTIAGNHDDTLYLPDVDFTVDEFTTYSILAPEMSGVFHRVSGAWVSTADAGADARFTDTNFRPLARQNAEDTFTEYGLYRPNDQPFTEACFQEICDAVNALDMIKVSGDWVDPTDNTREAGWHNVTEPQGGYAAWADRVVNGRNEPPPNDEDNANTGYYLYNGPNDGVGPPYAVWDAWVTGQYLPPTPSWQVTSGYVGDVRRLFSFYQVTLPDNVYAKDVKFYNFATLPISVMGTPSAHNLSTVVFDDEGDPVAEDVWTMWSTGSGTTGTVTSAQLGSLTVPNDAGAPSIAALPAATVPDTGTSGHASGYKVTNALATISYGFPALTI